MEYQKFLCVVEKEMNQKLKGGVTASIHKTVKNNGKVRRGIVIENPRVNISPTIYLEEFYERFCNKESLESIVKDVMSFYESVKYEESWDTANVENYDAVQDKIVFKIIHTKRNEELLATVPHINLLDLSIVFYVLLEVKKDGTATMLIRNEHLKIWRIEENELFPLACENGQQLLPAQILTMQETIEELANPEQKRPRNLLEEPKEVFRDAIYVLTNSIRSFGAGCIMYPGLLEKVGLLLGENYYILPSSVHEWILVPESKGLDPEKMNMMVQEVNKTQVEEEEQLSDHIYFYERKKKQLMIR